MNKFFRGKAGKFAALLVGFGAAGSAMAEGELSTVIVAELAAGKTEILAVGGAVLILVAVVTLIRHIRSSAR